MMNNSANPADTEVLISPPMLYMGYIKEHLRSGVLLCAQNCSHVKDAGAYTGEIAPTMLYNFGITHTILGHSERRKGFGMEGESPELVAQKVLSAIQAGLHVILCVGEEEDDRVSGRTMEVVDRQLAAVRATVSEELWAQIDVAYEPVWAIGTGRTPTVEQIEETHSAIRQWLRTSVSDQAAETCRILYGGSVNGGNCDSFINARDVDGFLVGGASLKPEFVKIIESAAQRA